jgi:hypothetical protein
MIGVKLYLNIGVMKDKKHRLKSTKSNGVVSIAFTYTFFPVSCSKGNDYRFEMRAQLVLGKFRE